MTRIPVGSVNVDIISPTSVYHAIKKSIAHRIPTHIVTLNALMFNSACKNPAFAKIVSRAALVIPDSYGIVWAVQIIYGIKASRIPGIDLIDDICSLSTHEGFRLFLLGGKDAVIEHTAQKLTHRYPSLNIVGTHNGYFTDDKKIVSIIKKTTPDILLVGLNVPRQEIWIAHHLTDLNVPIVMGVGGSFDVISGTLKRAPLWVQRIHAEWFFRFLQQPWRIVRIKGLPLFVWNIVRIKLNSLHSKSETSNKAKLPKYKIQNSS